MLIGSCSLSVLVIPHLSRREVGVCGVEAA